MHYEQNITNWYKTKQYYKNIVLSDIFSDNLFLKKHFTKIYNNCITQTTSQEVVFLYLTYPLRISREIVVNAASKLTNLILRGR